MRRRLFLLGLVAGVAGCRRRPELPVVPVGGDFTLTAPDGQPFRSASLRGKVVLLFFGYTFCPDVCPATLSKIAAVRRALGDEAAHVKTVFISVDPKRDTPAVLRAHLGQFSVDAVGLTGTDAALAQVAQQFGAGFEVEPSDSAASYVVAHSTTLYGIDPEGHTRCLFRYDAPVDEIVDGVRAMLQDAA